MATFDKAANQQLLDKIFGAGKAVAGNGGGETALQNATPEQRQQYITARQGYDGQSSYQPTLAYTAPTWNGASSNQQLLDSVLGAGKAVAGSGGGEIALAQATPQQQALYTQLRDQFAGQQGYKPIYGTTDPTTGQLQNPGVQTVGQVADLTPWQQQAATTAANGYQNTSGIDFSNQLLQQAQKGITGAIQPMTQDQFTSGVNQYMNPYTQQVVDATNQQINHQAGIDANNINAQFNQGAFGSSANRVAQQELDRQTQQNVANADAPLYSAGYTTAVTNTNNQFNQGQAAQLAGYGQFNPLANTSLNNQAAGQNLYTTNLNNLLNSGNLVQNQNQNQLNATNQALQQQQQYPMQQLNSLTQLLQAFNGGTGGTAATPNLLQMLGGAGLVAGTNSGLSSSFNNLFSGNSGQKVYSSPIGPTQPSANSYNPGFM